MITAKIIADSYSDNGQRLTTFELEYPRFIHSEVNTHRMLSRNAASSRAIPIKTMLGLVWNNPASPIHWGRNRSGMQANEELTGFKLWVTKKLWNLSGKVACGFAYAMHLAGCHKQVVNRIVEPWSHIKVVVSATEWDNFFHLRNHSDAQPEIHELARQMWDLYKTNTPKQLEEGEWHLPYLDGYNILPKDVLPSKPNDIYLEDAKKLSASLCAQVSYRKSDESIEKAIRIYDRLVTSEPIHASPFEHQATPAKSNIVISGNFRGWIQFRSTIPNNVCRKYKG
jgi:thymidylate synthase ThyX